MAGVLATVAAAMVTDLNAAPLTNFGTDFTAVRSRAEWSVALQDLDKLHVDVVPAGLANNTMADRGGNLRYQAVVHIGIRKRFRRDETTKRFDLTDVDDLEQLTQNISDWFASDDGEPHRLTTMSKATWLAEGEKGNRSEVLVSCDNKMLDQHSQYTGIVQVVYEVVQAPA